MPDALRVDISPGELFDKITILEIKCERMSDPDKLANIRYELDKLQQVRAQACQDSVELAALTTELRAINLALWEIEDAIRDCERNQDFSAAFVELARAVYRTNDRRSAVKRRINEHLESELVEEKSYAAY